MKVEVACKTCKTAHFDHYECDKCHSILHLPIYAYFTLEELEQQKIKNPPYNYCPYCGERL